MTTPSITDLLKYADLQMAAEAFLVSNDPPYALKADLQVALKEGNFHSSKFTELQATDFLKHWKVVDQQPNTETGFSGTLFQCINDDPNTGAKAGELVMSFRSTEFVDDAARDNQATNDLEIKETGFAWGQIRDMEAWYAQLLLDGMLTPGAFSVTGYSLGGHLATVFNQLHPGAAQQVVTFNGAGVGQVKAGNTLGALVQQFADLSSPELDGSGNFSFANPELAAIYERVRLAIEQAVLTGDFSSDLISLSDSAQLTQWKNSEPFGEADPSEVDEATRRDAALLWDALQRVETVRKEVERLKDDVVNLDRTQPKEVPTAQVGAIDLVKRWQRRLTRFKHSLKLALLGTAVLALSACGTSTASSRGIDKTRQETAIAMWKERCQKAGEFIHQTVEDVEGVYLLKLRPKEPNFGDQFLMDDPYGKDVYGMGLAQQFLRKDPVPGKETTSVGEGYRHVVAKDLNDGQLYRFTGSWVSTRKKDVTSPWIQAELKKDPNFDLNIYDFVLQKAAPQPLPRYGVTWDDISTREEREYWIAGSSLKVIDLQTNKVIAERVGYMVDWAQGSKAGNRSPWLFAADMACPVFAEYVDRKPSGSTAQIGQTYRFVSKVLKPKQ